MKNLVTAGTSAANAKMNKSGILKKSIDKIRSLETENIELKMENHRLRQMLGMKALPDTGPTPLSPPNSNSSSPMPHSKETSHCIENMTDAPKPQSTSETDQKIIFIQRGVAPHSKFALCIFMFSVVALNSFGSIFLTDRPSFDFNDGNYNVENARRAILSTMMDDVSFNLLFLIPYSIENIMRFSKLISAIHGIL